MGTVFSGLVYLIDNDIERANVFRANLANSNQRIFFYHFFTVEDALTHALKSYAIAPDYIYVHALTTNTEVMEILRKITRLSKTQSSQITIFGKELSERLHSFAEKHNITLVKTYPEADAAGCSIFNERILCGKNNVVCPPSRKCC